jgi:hypothetical protein
MRRLPVIAAVLAALLLAPAAATAARAPAYPKLGRWTAVFEAQQVVNWELPRYETSSDCYHRWWGAGRGAETWVIRSRGATRVLAYQGSAQTPIAFRFGTWDWLGVGGDGIAAAGMIERAASESSGRDPGDCGGDSRVNVPEARNCGSRLPDYAIGLAYERGRVELFLKQGNRQTGYGNCPLYTPRRWTDGSFKQPLGRVDPQRLLSGRGTLVISASDGERTVETLNPGGGQRSSSATVRWTLRLMDGADYARYERELARPRRAPRPRRARRAPRRRRR